jgi:hypothetical protein
MTNNEYREAKSKIRHQWCNQMVEMLGLSQSAARRLYSHSEYFIKNIEQLNSEKQESDLKALQIKEQNNQS